MCAPPVKLDHHFSTTENKNYTQKILETIITTGFPAWPLCPPKRTTTQPTSCQLRIPGAAGIKRQSSGPRPLRLSAAAAKTKPCVKPKLQKPSAPPAEGVSGHPKRHKKHPRNTHFRKETSTQKNTLDIAFIFGAKKLAKNTQKKIVLSSNPAP